MIKLNDILQVNMQPYRPLFINDRNEKGISQDRYMEILKTNSSHPMSKSIDVGPNSAISKNVEENLGSQITPQYFNQILLQNQLLAAKLFEEQNKAQYVTNKYLYQQMMMKKMEYERLIKKQERKSKLPQINTQRENLRSRKNNDDINRIESFRESSIKNPSRENKRRAISIIPQIIDHEVETPKVYKLKYFGNKRILSYAEVATEVEKMKEKQRLEEEKQARGAVLWKKFLKCYLIIQIVIRWSENIRKKRKLKQQKQEQQNNKAKALFRAIKKVDTKQQNVILVNWVKLIMDDIFLAMNSEEMKKVFSKNFYPKQISSLELQKKWLTYFSLKLFQNIEKNTRVNSFPDFLCYQMTLQLYRYQDKEASIFVALRTTYLSANVFELSQQEMSLIVSEYILFRMVIPTILTLEKEHTYLNQDHMAQCRKILFFVFSILQILFISLFYQLEQKKILGKLNVTQKRIEIVSQKTHELKFSIDTQIDEAQGIIAGLEKKQTFESYKLLQPEILQDLSSFLEVIIENLSGNILT